MIPSGGDGSEETITCTIGAYGWPGMIGVRSSVVEGRYCLTSAQLPICGRLCLFLCIYLFILVQSFPSFSMEESLKQFSVVTFASVQVDRDGHVSPYTLFFPAVAEQWRNVLN